MGLSQPMTIVTDKAHSNARVMGGWGASGPDDAIRHITRKQAGNRVEGDHALLKQRLRPMRGLQSLSTAYAKLKGIETFREVPRADFEACEAGVLNQIRFVQSLFDEGEAAAWRGSSAQIRFQVRTITRRTPQETAGQSST